MRWLTGCCVAEVSFAGRFGTTRLFEVSTPWLCRSRSSLTASSHHSLQDCDWLDRFCWMAELAGDVSSPEFGASLATFFRATSQVDRTFSLGSGFVSGHSGAESLAGTTFVCISVCFESVHSGDRFQRLGVEDGWVKTPSHATHSFVRGHRRIDASVQDTRCVRGNESMITF